MTESGLLPTLKASDVKIMGCPSERNRKSPCLESMVNIWPTPKALDWNKRRSVSHHPRTGLPDAVVKFPIPIASDLSKGGRLNPNWVEWLMVWPIEGTSLKLLEMNKFQSWLKAHLNF